MSSLEYRSVNTLLPQFQNTSGESGISVKNTIVMDLIALFIINRMVQV